VNRGHAASYRGLVKEGNKCRGEDMVRKRRKEEKDVQAKDMATFQP